MEPFKATELQSINYGDKAMQIGIEELESLVMATENNNSFTALLELPPNQAVELLHSGDSRGGAFNHTLDCAFPSNIPSINRAVKCSVSGNENSPEPSNLSAGLAVNVKSEPVDSGWNPNSSDPMVTSECEKPLKRKEREKKGKSSSKKNKTVANPCSDDGEKLPYVHVRARRGQATDSHSLAERARREKINAKMKLLQELVPGCNKISGTALVLDEIINHVQSLQRQVEYLSMRLAAVNPRIDVNIDSLISAGTEQMVECNLSSIAVPQVWSEIHGNGDKQQFQQQWHFNSWNQPMLVKEPNHCELTENSLLSYDSSRNSGMQSSQVKMEL